MTDRSNDSTEHARLVRAVSRKETILLGLPFDVLTEDQSLEVLDDAIASNHRCFLSTPNLNFAIASMRDDSFRQSVMESDLSVGDGMPLIWVSRLIGEYLPERVAGSSLFESMRRREAAPVSIFFFGGMGDVAKRAEETLKLESLGIRAVGSLNPGIGSVNEMSTPEIIEQINADNPDFIIVSLGAKKGQQWIMANQAKLKAPIISHLGAVVNFVAGTVERAPEFYQKTGLEWVWRIREEPNLWKRYFYDGIDFLKVVVTKMLPLAIYGRWKARSTSISELMYSTKTESGSTVLSLSGIARNETLDALKETLPEVILNSEGLVLDVQHLVFVDGSFWALVLRLQVECRRRGISFQIGGLSQPLKRLARLYMVDRLLPT